MSRERSFPSSYRANASTQKPQRSEADILWVRRGGRLRPPVARRNQLVAAASVRKTIYLLLEFELMFNGFAYGTLGT